MSKATIAPTRRGLLAGMALIAGALALPARARAATVKHVVLLGDSAFANAAYTKGAPDVAAQLKKLLPSDWQVTLLAADSALNADIAAQLERLPEDTSHLVLSVGGDNALGLETFFKDEADLVADALDQLDEIREDFTTSYRKMLDAVLARKLPTAISTIHDSRYSDAERAGMANTALAIYNDVITREAFARGLPLVDLRLIMSEQIDYANPIEPSAKGHKNRARRRQPPHHPRLRGEAFRDLRGVVSLPSFRRKPEFRTRVMCARYDLVIAQEIYERAFKTVRLPQSNFPPRYNIAPTDQVPIVRIDPRDGMREVVVARPPIHEAPNHPVAGDDEVLHGRRQVRKGGEEPGPEPTVGLAPIADEGVVIAVIVGHELVHQIRIVLVEHPHERFGEALCSGGHVATPIRRRC